MALSTSIPLDREFLASLTPEEQDDAYVLHAELEELEEASEADLTLLARLRRKREDWKLWEARNRLFCRGREEAETRALAEVPDYLLEFYPELEEVD